MHLGAVDLRGVWVPIVTPFDTTGSLDEVALERLATRLLADGATGLVALGTTGEPATLSVNERQRVAAVCGAVAQLADKPLIAGAGSNSTQATIEEIELLNAAAHVGAALVVVPYYTRPTEPAIVEHFHLVATVSPIPIVAYNVPYRTGRYLSAEAVLDVADHPNIIGLKQSVGCIDRDTLQILRHHRENFSVLAGDDAFIVASILMGATGTIAAAAHVCTPGFVSMVDAALERDIDSAVAMAEALLPVVDAGFAEPNPAVWKGALHRMGELSSDSVRRPMTSATDGAVNGLLRCIDEITDSRSQ